MSTSPASALSVKSIALWVLRVLLAALFLFAAYMKLSSNPMMVSEFETVGLGQWFRYVTGLLELGGAIALLIPKSSLYGAALLLCVDIGAFVAQIGVLHMDWVHTIVIGALLGLTIWLQSGSRAR